MCYIGDRPYRAPELHLGSQVYTESVDIWALGCLMVEMTTGKQLFKGSGGIDCLLNIGRFFGTKEMKKISGDTDTIQLMPNIQGKGLEGVLTSQKADLVNLLIRMLRVDPSLRLKSIDILAHEYFD